LFLKHYSLRFVGYDLSSLFRAPLWDNANVILKNKILQEIQILIVPKSALIKIWFAAILLYLRHIFLFFIRFRIADWIFCLLLIFGTSSPFLMTSRKRLVTISLFLNWLRSSSQFRIKTKSVVLEDKFTFSNSFSSSLNPQNVAHQSQDNLRGHFVYILSTSSTASNGFVLRFWYYFCISTYKIIEVDVVNLINHLPFWPD
jgi:hypothetical protein